jgi:hypothetical protein
MGARRIGVNGIADEDEDENEDVVADGRGWDGMGWGVVRRVKVDVNWGETRKSCEYCTE